MKTCFIYLQCARCTSPYYERFLCVFVCFGTFFIGTPNQLVNDVRLVMLIFSYPALTETWYGKSFDKIENKRSRLYKQSTSFVFVVPLTGLEPVRSRPRGIFLLLYVAIAARIGRCSLDFIFTLDIFLRCAPSSLYTFLEGEPLRLRSVLSPMGEFHRI